MGLTFWYGSILNFADSYAHVWKTEWKVCKNETKSETHLFPHSVDYEHDE